MRVKSTFNEFPLLESRIAVFLNSTLHSCDKIDFGLKSIYERFCQSFKTLLGKDCLRRTGGRVAFIAKFSVEIKPNLR